MSKSRFNKIRDVITKSNESKLMTKLEKRNITPKSAEKLLELIISGEINKKKGKNMFNNIAEDANKLNKLEVTESRKNMRTIFKQLEEVFWRFETGDEVDDETNIK